MASNSYDSDSDSESDRDESDMNQSQSENQKNAFYKLNNFYNKNVIYKLFEL